MLEREVENKLRTEIKKIRGLCLKWVCPSVSGVPDRIILLPGGHVAFAEAKRPRGGILSKLQLKWGEKLQRMGFPYAVIRSPEDAKEFVTYLKSKWNIS